MMMKIKNHVQLIGRLGANPEVKTLENGTKVARFNIAVAQIWSDRNGDRITDVQWHAIAAWGSLATIAQKILHKGTEVTVDGKLFNRSYTGRDGVKRTITEIVASELFVSQQKAA
jgi:single-strand DNA-binding protein